MVPDWAVQRIRSEFTCRPGRPPEPLLHIDIVDVADGMDARTRHLPTSTEASDAFCPSVVLAQLRPDLALTAELDPPLTGASDEGLPGFFYRTHRFIRHGGTLLVACRQQHHGSELVDPQGHLVACARTAGFVYRQHILIVHATAKEHRLLPTPDAPAPVPAPVWRHQPIHTDLLYFSAV